MSPPPEKAKSAAKETENFLLLSQKKLPVFNRFLSNEGGRLQPVG